MENVFISKLLVVKNGKMADDMLPAKIILVAVFPVESLVKLYNRVRDSS